jgi:hypothetical protein
MGNMDFPFDRPPLPRPRRQQVPTRAQQAPTPAQYSDDDDEYDDADDYIEALAYHTEEVKDDNDDYVVVVFQDWELAMAEDRKFELPDNMTDDEMAKLGVLITENVPHVQPPLPRYATGFMPPGLSEDEALRLALQNSAMPQPPPYNPWAPQPPPYPWASPPQPQPWAPSP